MARHENKIAPQTDAEANGGDFEEEDEELDQNLDEEQEPTPSLLDLPFLRNISRFFDSINYDCIKSTVRWLLETAKIDFSISIDDIMMAMTLFVLFGNNIAYMAASQTVDAGFSTVNSICLFFFIAEFLANSWSKTNINSIKKLDFDGYLFCFFWFCDLAAIISMLPDISWIARPLGMGAATTSVGGNSSYSKAGRVVRLVRLVRLVKLYKIASERKKRQEQEEELMELVRMGVISYEEIEKRRALYKENQSRLGIQLSESITRKVIIIILVMLIVLPTLTYNATNNATYFATDSIHAIISNPSLVFAAKQLMIEQFIDSFQVNQATLGTPIKQTQFLVYLMISPWGNETNPEPLINEHGILNYIRGAATEDHFLSTEVNGVTYITHAIFSNNDLLRLTSML